MYIFSIEGNISAGKSTFLKRLKLSLTDIYNLPVIYLEEPIDEWESIMNKDGTNMIQLFYSDTKRYAFAFQMMAYISRLKLIQDTIRENPKSIIITERCLLSDYNIFATMLYESGDLLAEEFSIYKKWFNHFAFPITGIIYMKCTPELAHERCISRNRTGETISLEYLTNCHNKHEEWMTNETIPILTICANEYTDLSEIRDFIFEEIDIRQPIPFRIYVPPIICIVISAHIIMIICIYRAIQ